MKTKNLDPFKTGWNPGDLATKLDFFADKLIRQSSSRAKTNKYHADGLEAAHRCKKVLVMAREELARADTDPLASFRAGWHLREALDLLDKWEYKRGKASNVTARAKRPRTRRDPLETPLGKRILRLWTLYLEDGARPQKGDKSLTWLKPTKNDFAFEWLRKNAELEGLVYDDLEPAVHLMEDQSIKVSPTTIRRWKLPELSG